MFQNLLTLDLMKLSQQQLGSLGVAGKGWGVKALDILIENFTASTTVNSVN